MATRPHASKAQTGSSEADGNPCISRPMSPSYFLVVLNSSRWPLIKRLLRATEIMVQGGLSETSRRCGNPNCICRDPKRLHGPHLYITYREDEKSRSLYVPPEHAETARRNRRGQPFGRSAAHWPS